MLLCFALPPLATVAAQAFVSRANANWAGAAYVAGSVLVAAWLLRWDARRWLIAGLAVQAVLAAVFLVWVIEPRTAEAWARPTASSGPAAGTRRVQAIIERAREEQALHGGLTAVAVDDRFLYNVAAYYGRDYFGTPAAPPLRMWVHEIASPQPGRDRGAAGRGPGPPRPDRQLGGPTAARSSRTSPRARVCRSSGCGWIASTRGGRTSSSRGLPARCRAIR
jgi:hypothetical protein